MNIYVDMWIREPFVCKNCYFNVNRFFIRLLDENERVFFRRMMSKVKKPIDSESLPQICAIDTE